MFGPQKGATPAQVKLLQRRLDRLVQMFDEDFDVDVTTIDGGGAAGGLGAALAALGGRLVPGFELVADELDVFDHLDVDNPDRVDLIVTGEGHLDATSFDGKVVGGMVELGRDAGIPVIAVVGDADPDIDASAGAARHGSPDGGIRSRLGTRRTEAVHRAGRRRTHRGPPRMN